MNENLPTKWEESIIEDVCDILDSMRKPVNSKERANRPGNVPYYGATGMVGTIDDYIFNEELILLGEDGAPFFDKNKNVAYLISGKSWVNNHAHVLRSRNKITLNKFVTYYLNQFDYTDYVGGTTRLKLNQGSLKKIPIPLPPLLEQERIVKHMDNSFDHLEEIKSRLAKIPMLMKDFRQAVLTQAVTGKLTEGWRDHNNPTKMDLDDIESKIERYPFEREVSFPVDWKVVKAETISLKITDGEHQTPKRIEKGKMLLSAKNVRDGFIDYTKYDSISKEDFDKCLKRCHAEQGDILIVSVGATIGRTSIVREEIEFALVRSVALVKPAKNILGNYLMFVFQCELLQNVIAKVSQGSAQPCLYINKIKGLPIPLPSLDEQSEIVSRVETLFVKADAIQSKYDSLKQKIDHLPQAILSKAFKGELVEQLPTDGNAKDLLKEINSLKAELASKKKSKKKVN